LDHKSCAIYIVLSERTAISDKVYLVLNVAEGKANQVAGKLKRVAGIRIVDVLEGLPDVIAVVEAPERHKLVEMTMRVISLVGTMIEDMKLLSARDGLSRHSSFESSHIIKKSKGKLEYA
jgi:hypothetical protein